MSDWYFYQDHGSTVGPFNLDDLRTRIRDGRVRVSDLIYREGEGNWRLALEHPTLRGEFKASTLTGLRDRPWVCLQRKATDDTGFLTIGPFTQEEVRTRLQSGEISYSDYAWKDGFYEWKRIGALEEFNPRARNAAVPPVPPVPQDSAVDLLKNVVELRRSRVTVDLPIPSEAVGPNLAKESPIKTMLPEFAEAVVRPSPLAKSTPASKAKTPTAKIPVIPAGPAPDPLANTQTAIGAPKRRRKQKPKLWVDAAMVGALVVTLLAAVFFISRFIRNKAIAANTIEIAPQPATQPVPVAAEPLEAVAQMPTPPVATQQPEVVDKDDLAAAAEPEEDKVQAAPAPAVKPVVHKKPQIPHKDPKQLFIAVANENNHARIEIRSDGSPDVPVLLQIIGLPGQMTEGGAYYRFARYSATGEVNHPIDLSGLKLPQGRFIVRAETGDLKKETKFTIGLQDPAYKGSVARQRKRWAHALWKERLVLYNLTQLLERQLARAIEGKAKKFSSKGLDQLISFRRSNVGGRLWFEDWWELHQIASLAARDGASEALLARVQKERDRVAVMSVWK